MTTAAQTETEKKTKQVNKSNADVGSDGKQQGRNPFNHNVHHLYLLYMFEVESNK